MARRRGAQAHGGSIEKHSLVFDRKTNAFRQGAASLPPPPVSNSEAALPRKLRDAMAMKAALKAGRNLLREKQQQQRKHEQQQKPPSDVAPKPTTAAAGQKPRGAPPAVGSAASDGVVKRKTAYLSPKARRKRALREKAAAEAAEPAATDRPRFMEVAEAPPAMALNRKHTLGVLFTKQMHAAKSRTSAADRESVIAAYRKLRGREALPFLATQARSLI